MVSKYGKDFQVPKDFPSVLKAFTREVLRSQPTNVYEFGAAYFQQLLAQAQSATAAEGGAETRLTPAQMEQMLIQLFKNADVDGSGELSMQEFKDLIKIANLGLSDADLTRLMAEADVNHDGKIDYGEFVPLAVDLVQGLYAKLDVKAEADAQEERARLAANEYMLHGMSKDALNAVILDVFRKSDKDNSGSLTIAEFHNCIREADLGLTRKEVNVLMHSVDVDMSGTITYEEFAPLCFDILVEILKDELLAAQRTPSDMETYLLEVFKAADPPKAGMLKAAELRDALREADLGLTRMQILTVVSEASVEDELGNIDYTGFAPKAAKMVHRLLDQSAQRERDEAVQRLLETDQANALVHGYTATQVEQIVADACAAADAGGTGFLDAAALVAALEASSLGLSAKEVQVLLNATTLLEGEKVEWMPLVADAFKVLLHLSHEGSYSSGLVA